MKRNSGQPVLAKASDGTIHAFPPGTPPTKIERYMWRYENGQSQKSMMVTARKSETVKPVRLDGFENPGAVFDNREAAAHDITSRINPLSRSQSKEYSWMYYTDPKTGKIGYSDPYQSGESGGADYGLPFTVAGTAPLASDNSRLTADHTFGMGHTHGSGSANTFSSRWDRDANGRPMGKKSDQAFMEGGGATGKWDFFTLGTPDGGFKQWTPKGKASDLLDAEWDLNQAASEFPPPRKPEYFRRQP